jgi:hypothetical protein
MVSQKQLEANRRNARKSTGPRTPEGKVAAARNATRHGLRAEKKLVPAKERKAFGEFYESVITCLGPDGHFETALAERIVFALWRLRRSMQIESGMLDETLKAAKRNASTFGDRPAREIWWQFSKKGSYENFRRYEAHLERSMYRALHELQRLQSVRRGDDVPAPAVLDVNISRAA